MPDSVNVLRTMRLQVVKKVDAMFCVLYHRFFLKIGKKPQTNKNTGTDMTRVEAEE